MMIDKLMSREEIEQIQRWNEADMRHGRAYATQPSITQITKLLSIALAAHDIYAQAYDKAIEDAAQVVEDEDCCSTISEIADHVRNLKGTSNG